MDTLATEHGTISLRHTFDVCVAKTRRNIERMADAPGAWSNDPHGDFAQWPEGFYEIGNWTSSFFTGMALLAWRETRDDFLLRQVERLDSWYRSKVGAHAMDTMHGLGFLYSLYAVALFKLTGKAAHRELGLRAAEVFAGRFMHKGGYLRAWGRLDEMSTEFAGLATIDCMMSLPLLYWATEETGDRRFRNIATRHADTTLRRFVRPDDSVCQAFRFDARTDEPIGPDNYAGYAVDSHWARGTAWAIYGFALSHRYTGEVRYLDAACRLAHRFLELLGRDPIPVWDFRVPAGEPSLRDSSAASVAVCGLQELLWFRPDDRALISGRLQLLEGLCGREYFDDNPRVPGILRKGEVGDGPGKAKYAYTSWGDYYLMEALAREMGRRETFW